MARENPLYRPLLEELKTKFPDRNVWSVEDICQYENITRATVNVRYGRPGRDGYTTAVYAYMKAARQWQSLGREAKDAIREAAG